MKSFEGLKEGTVIHNDVDGDMIVRYSAWFSETNEKELCFESENMIWRGCQFDPADWEIKDAPADWESTKIKTAVALDDVRISRFVH